MPIQTGPKKNQILTFQRNLKHWHENMNKEVDKSLLEKIKKLTRSVVVCVAAGGGLGNSS
ncbi:hypothetical protein MTR_6g017175 [Medicago truncatula]|uniref:Uncharacterized protein n=1 Tax=Medicago truncatula TaxID=3880 RepID=G7ZY76_MEDTR|nr:hypothetical protein MTR_6g017175 [Medicago truncatula]